MNRELLTGAQNKLIVAFRFNADCDHHGYRSWGAEEPNTWCDETTVFNLPERCKSDLFGGGLRERRP
jgi:hypothetical protein